MPKVYRLKHRCRTRHTDDTPIKTTRTVAESTIPNFYRTRHNDETFRIRNTEYRPTEGNATVRMDQTTQTKTAQRKYLSEEPTHILYVVIRRVDCRGPMQDERDAFLSARNFPRKFLPQDGNPPNPPGMRKLSGLHHANEIRTELDYAPGLQKEQPHLAFLILPKSKSRHTGIIPGITYLVRQYESEYPTRGQG